MNYINAQQLKDYVQKVINNRKKCGVEPSDDLFQILGHIVCLMEKEEPNKNTDINLVEILKNKPRETPLYSPMYGNLWLADVDERNGIITCYRTRLEEDATRPILEQADTVAFFANGTTGDGNGNVTKDCQLWFTGEPNNDTDLGEAANSFYDICQLPKSSYWDDGVLYKMTDTKGTFIAGAEWQKHQMMKDKIAEILKMEDNKC